MKQTNKHVQDHTKTEYKKPEGGECIRRAMINPSPPWEMVIKWQLINKPKQKIKNHKSGDYNSSPFGEMVNKPNKERQDLKYNNNITIT